MGTQALAQLEAMAAPVEGLRQEAERARTTKEEAEKAAEVEADDDGDLEMEVDGAAAPSGRRAARAPYQLAKNRPIPNCGRWQRQRIPTSCSSSYAGRSPWQGGELVLEGVVDGDVLAKRQCVPDGDAAASAATPSPSPEAGPRSG